MGTVKHPGRFPWRNDKSSFQHREKTMEQITKLKSKGKSNKEIAEELGIKEAQVRSAGS